jgi:hypothetical protein
MKSSTDGVIGDRRSYWRALTNSQRDGDAPIFDGAYTKSLLLAEKEFAPLYQIVFKILENTLVSELKLNREALSCNSKILDAINQTKALKIQRDWNLMTKLESSVLTLLRAHGFLPEILGIEFPINVRVAHGAPPAGYAETNYATDHLHSDLWAGEPSDIVHGLIYIDGDLLSTFMDLRDCPEALVSAIENYTGTYKEGFEIIRSCPAVSYTPQSGQLILFDGVCAHQTIRKGGNARISVDFRLRRSDPYFFLDERWNRERAPWSKYWYLPQVDSESFVDRCANELRMIAKTGNNDAYHARKRWIDQLGSAELARALDGKA